MIKVSWQNQFKDNISGAEKDFNNTLSESIRPVPAHESTPTAFLSYCLHQHLIPPKEYLEWARETHQVPVLMDEFFMAYGPSTVLFQSYHSVYTWSSFCVPIAEWDGVLMVACLEIPTDFPLDQPAAFLLASPHHLAETWAAYAQLERPAALPSLKSANALEGMSPLAAGLSLESGIALDLKLPSAAPQQVGTPEELFAEVEVERAPKALFDANGDLILADEELVAAESNPEIQLNEVESEGLPEGFFAETVVDTPTLGALGALQPAGAVPVVEKISETQTIKPLAKPLEKNSAATLEPALQAKSEPNLELNLELTLDSRLENTSLEVTALATKTVQLPLVEDTVTEQIRTKGPRTVVALDPVVSMDNLQTPPSVPEARAVPKAPVKTTTPVDPTAAAYLLEKFRKPNTNAFDKEVMATFKQMKTFFKKSMLLAIGDKDRVIKPLLWDSGFVASETAKSEFELKTPSFFRIVATTQKPYHGFVTPSDFNDTFFEAWNHGQIPDHITLVPVMDGDLVIGMLLGLGEKSSYNRNVLQFCENASKEFSAKMLKGTAVPAVIGSTNKSVA